MLFKENRQKDMGLGIRETTREYVSFIISTIPILRHHTYKWAPLK